jgi:hypothetical protein
MRILPGVPAIALVTLLAGPACAQSSSPDAPAAAPAPKLICVRGQADTGSHFGASKVCHTESEWAMIHNQSAHTMEHFDSQTSQQAPAGGR